MQPLGIPRPRRARALSAIIPVLIAEPLLLLMQLQLHAVVTRPIKIGRERRGVARGMCTQTLLLLLLLLQSGENCH